VRKTKLASSLVNFRVHYKIVRLYIYVTHSNFRFLFGARLLQAVELRLEINVTLKQRFSELGCQLQICTNKSATVYSVVKVQ